MKMSEEHQIQETAGSILSSVACKGNWPASAKIDALLDYIENQQNNDAFRDFLEERFRREDEASTRAFMRLVQKGEENERKKRGST